MLRIYRVAAAAAAAAAASDSMACSACAMLLMEAILQRLMVQDFINQQWLFSCERCRC